jgi:UDP-2-acetamido-2-deoxy-ribo-hexuluronate aminotransferase
VELVDLQSQYRRYQGEIDRRVQAVLAHGRFILGPEVAELEGELARRVGVAHAITVSSGTHALEIALRALGVGPGDEVITVAFTWISTAEAIALVGAVPVFVDIEPRSFNIDISRIEAAISPRTRALLPVSLFGQMPDYAAINAIAERHGLAVIEDAAQSFGAAREGRPSCGVTRVAATSFFPSKPLGCYGDGGALFTSDEALAGRLRAIRTHGSEQRHEHPLLGTNGRFDTLQAAILLAKLPHLPEELARRAEIARGYDEALRGCCVVPEVMAGNTHVYAQYTLRTPRRDALAVALAEQGIPSAIHYAKCVHQQPPFASCPGARSLPESERAAREVISLPLHPFLSDADRARVVSAVHGALTG